VCRFDGERSPLGSTMAALVQKSALLRSPAARRTSVRVQAVLSKKIAVASQKIRLIREFCNRATATHTVIRYRQSRVSTMHRHTVATTGRNDEALAAEQVVFEHTAKESVPDEANEASTPPPMRWARGNGRPETAVNER
jgi:hypothetical protein